MSVRIELPDHAELRPFAIVGPSGAARFDADELRLVDALDEAETDYCAAMNRANCLSYDGSVQPGGAATALGMPRWVMLDCCILPSGVFGFETRREHLPSALADTLDPSGDLDWIGVSEYIAIPAVREGEFIGASLFSLVGGRRLGSRTKALALRSLGARRQTGVTQWAGAGVKLHLGFGPLRVVSPHVAIHNRPVETFVYEVEVPSAAVLQAIEAGEKAEFARPVGRTVTCDPRHEDVSALVAAHDGAAYIVGAGDVVAGELAALELVLADE